MTKNLDIKREVYCPNPEFGGTQEVADCISCDFFGGVSSDGKILACNYQGGAQK